LSEARSENAGKLYVVHGEFGHEVSPERAAAVLEEALRPFGPIVKPAAAGFVLTPSAKSGPKGRTFRGSPQPRKGEAPGPAQTLVAARLAKIGKIVSSSDQAAAPPIDPAYARFDAVVAVKAMPDSRGDKAFNKDLRAASAALQREPALEVESL